MCQTKLVSYLSKRICLVLWIEQRNGEVVPRLNQALTVICSPPFYQESFKIHRDIFIQNCDFVTKLCRISEQTLEIFVNETKGIGCILEYEWLSLHKLLCDYRFKMI